MIRHSYFSFDGFLNLFCLSSGKKFKRTKPQISLTIGQISLKRPGFHCYLILMKK